METLDGKIYSGEETSESEEKEYEHLKIGLRRIYEKRAEGAIFRSKVRWIQEGKKLTKYFFNPFPPMGMVINFRKKDNTVNKWL